jgi:hypothetical protein
MVSNVFNTWHMLVYGTANPEGFGSETYQGLYLTSEDIDTITPQMVNVPVKVEHSVRNRNRNRISWVSTSLTLSIPQGSDVGRVVSSWKHNGRMELLLDIDENKLQGAFVREFVEKGICKVSPSKVPKPSYVLLTQRTIQDLSLGYNVQMSKNASGKLIAGNKKVIEVSIVKKGARDDCHIRGWNQKHKILI